MGTAKRTSRDVALHSPLAGLHAHHLATYCDEGTQQAVLNNLRAFYQHLETILLILRHLPFEICVCRLAQTCLLWNLLLRQQDRR